LTTDAPLRQSLVQRGLVRAADYSWAASAAQTVAVYRSVVGSAT
jgi:hypothetical protein